MLADELDAFDRIEPVCCGCVFACEGRDEFRRQIANSKAVGGEGQNAGVVVNERIKAIAGIVQSGVAAVRDIETDRAVEYVIAGSAYQPVHASGIIGARQFVVAIPANQGVEAGWHDEVIVAGGAQQCPQAW